MQTGLRFIRQIWTRQIVLSYKYLGRVVNAYYNSIIHSNQNVPMVR